MKNNLAIVVALVALGLSVWSALERPRPVEPRTKNPAAEHLPAPPQVDTAHPECGDPGSVANLKVLMRAQINPTMTHLSFALHHDQRAERLQKAAESAARLLACIHLAPSLPPADIGIGGLPDYFRFLGNMQENALGVQIAAMENDLEGARHWFGHLKQDCVACHSRFRVETDGPAASP